MRIGSGYLSVRILAQKLVQFVAWTKNCRRIFLAALASVIFAHVPAFAQTPCGSGLICQGSGCKLPGDTSNPSDILNFNFPAGTNTVSIAVTRSLNPATATTTQDEETGHCKLSFDEQGNVPNGQFTAGLETVPADSGTTQALGVTPNSENVVYTHIGSAPGVSLKIGPPTSSASCQLPSDRKAFNYAATCSFNPNPDNKSRLKVVKDLNPSSDPGTFNLQIDGTTLATGGDGIDTGFVPVNEDQTYNIKETGAGGTDLSNYDKSLSCVSSQSPAATYINLSDADKVGSTGAKLTIKKKGSDITCTIVNTRKTGNIEIKKESTDGNKYNDPTFEVKLDGTLVKASGDANPDGLKISETTGLVSVPTGSHTVSETNLPAGWTLDSIVCTKDGAPVGNGGTFTVEPDKNYVCTVKNTKTLSRTGQIQIKKESTDGLKYDDPTFLVLLDGILVKAAADLVADGLKIDESTSVQSIAIGIHTVSEPVLPPGWTLDNIACTQNGAAVGNGGEIDVQADKTYICTVKNKKTVTPNAKVTLKKITTDGSTGTFNFSSTVPGLTVGITTTGGSGSVGPNDATVGVQQTITEADPAPTYKLTGAQCQLTGGGNLANPVNVDLVNRTVSFTPSANEEIICTFTNFKKSDDPMEEETERFIHRRVDNLLTYGPDRARMLRRLQDPPQQQQSLKDEPLKLGAVSTSLGGASAAGGGSFGQMDAMSALPSSSNRMAAVGSTLGTNPFAKAKLPGDETDDEEVVAYGQQAAPSMFSQVAGQFTPLVNGQGSYSFSTSLSELRAAAVSAEEQSSRKKLQDAGLSLASQPYTNPYLTSRQGLDVWVEGHVAKYDDDVGGINREGDFRLLYIGADYLLRPGFLIGALVQIDDTNEDIDDPVRSGNIDGTGWLAGPYVGIKVLENLYFDARAAWGQSDNDIELIDAAGARSGSFDTDRWLATASLTGNERFGAWRFSPQIAIAYGSESSDAYTNSLGQSVGSTDAKIGRLTGTAEVGYRFQRADGTMIEPHVALTGIWNFDSDDLTVNGVVVDTEESRAKVDGGVLITLPSGLGVRGAASYDGIGADDYHAVSGSLWLNVPLN